MNIPNELIPPGGSFFYAKLVITLWMHTVPSLRYTPFRRTGTEGRLRTVPID